MDTINKSRRAFIEKLGDENRNFYGSPDGRGLLSVIELTFDHRWVYLFELVQNALDVGATSIAIQVTEAGEVLIFEHDGARSLDENDVEGLSKIFRSTKGPRSVGFMGIGFKSVFTRFQETRISGWGWNFKYQVAQVIGEEFGDVQRDLLGAVVPIWDESIDLPRNGYTTRFEMRRRWDGETDLESDIVRFLSDHDRASLAILAMSGLERLDIVGRKWELGVSEEPDESFEATAFSQDENRLWRVFSARFEPSREAIACFLEHRQIRPAPDAREQVYADAARARRVLGVLPLDNDGFPKPPSRGHVYATLPTEVTLPFGIHINADWLLNISRKDLREIEDNPWQRGIVGTISDILARFLQWSARAHYQPHAAKAAFRVLSLPSSETVGLESLFADEWWLSTLRDRIADAAVIPVWTETTGKVAYAKAKDTLVPAPPLAKAFVDRPELNPGILLSGRVLMGEVIGRKAAGLLGRIGLLSEMSREKLESAWESGLEDWWKALPEAPRHRRRLIFRLWAAIAELSSVDGWAPLNVRCVRTVAGNWVSVGRSTFLNEPLASDEEPGGSATRRLMNPLVPDANRLDTDWVNTLRQPRRQHPDHGVLSRAWAWIEEHARSISLREILDNALDQLVLGTNPDWSVLIPLGHWAKHRNRPDLLTHVLVASNGDQLGAPVGDSLLADPYVDHGTGRRLLFSNLATISGRYVELDPKRGGAHEWRTFFERAGAKGGVTIRDSRRTVNRCNRETVAKFLGYDVNAIPESNNRGYTLSDFDIDPCLPSPDAPRELRAALAPWLEDGYRVLKAKGRRKASYTYYSRYERTGSRPSSWVAKLSQLEWVPCYDDHLRIPGEVLADHDPAREDVPVAKLSCAFLAVLGEEGLIFGNRIPESTAVSKLSAVGSQLDAVGLASLLSECRGQVTTHTDGHLLKKVLHDLRLPTIDQRRIRIDRIVRRVGGRMRGALGGWIVPLDRIDEVLLAELEHADFPWDIPETTTGDQALGYILDVWSRARMSPEGLANAVRDVLPTAYGYFMEDSGVDASLLERWQSVAHRAMVFADREWIDLADTNEIYFGDIDDFRFLPRQRELRTVTGGHLGRSRSERIRVAEAIGIPLLSTCVTMEWIVGEEKLRVSDDWISRFDLICELLRWVRGREPVEGGGPEFGVVAISGPSLTHVRRLSLEVSVGHSSAERVPVNARLHGSTLTVAGHPLQFGADAAKELLRYFAFGQRAAVAADLTGMLMAIDHLDFALAAEKFRRSHAPEFEFAAEFAPYVCPGGDVGSEGGPGDVDEVRAEVPEGEAVGNLRSGHRATAGNVEEVEPDASCGAVAAQVDDGASEKPEAEESDSMGGSYSRERALAKQNALARELKRSLKGEIVPGHEEYDGGEPATTSGEKDKILGDEEYRAVAAQYEREAGRVPELGDPGQSGWDIRSIDPETHEVRLIEIKGRGRPWDDAEVVELSRAQIRKAFEATESWYLYVVEKTDEGRYQVLPIENPACIATKWILCGESWRLVAEDARTVVSPLNQLR